MKFGNELMSTRIPEWRKMYISYEEMKSMLYTFVERWGSRDGNDPAHTDNTFSKFDEKFLEFCETELEKTNSFFSEQLLKANRKFNQLHVELNIHNPNKDVNRMVKPKVNKMFSGTNLRHIRLAFSEFYLNLNMIQQYQSLNITGFRKILKKHDKLLRTDSGTKWRQTVAEASDLYTIKEVSHLIIKTEDFVTYEIEGGDRRKAMERLRVPPLEERISFWTTFKVGLFTGIIIIMSMAIVISAFLIDHEEPLDWVKYMKLYRGTYFAILITMLLSVNIYGWAASGVNHVLIFELNPRDFMTYQHLLEISLFFFILWEICLFLDILTSFSKIPGFFMEIPTFSGYISFMIFCLLFLLNPFRILLYKSRLWLLKTVFNLAIAPFAPVKFADFWLADQLNSLAMSFTDLQFMFCFYSVEVGWLDKPDNKTCYSSLYGIPSIISVLPAWFRFAQCLRRYVDTKHVFPHLVNAGKYSTSFFSAIFAGLLAYFRTKHLQRLAADGEEYTKESIEMTVFLSLWFMSRIVSSFYTLMWDLKMDWGFFSNTTSENRFLRDEIVYEYKALYYFAMIEDIVLRFIWIFFYLIKDFTSVNVEVILTIQGTLEIFRRFVWNFLRLENEHLNNCGDFRAVRDISIIPIKEMNETLLESVMDGDDGPITLQNFRNRNPLPISEMEKYLEITNIKDVLLIVGIQEQKKRISTRAGDIFKKSIKSFKKTDDIKSANKFSRNKFSIKMNKIEAISENVFYDGIEELEISNNGRDFIPFENESRDSNKEKENTFIRDINDSSKGIGTEFTSDTVMVQIEKEDKADDLGKYNIL